ncbi:MAG: hypothetical protein DRO99_04865, partial [Candidatus Aenigmatarchaeota archaeon]
MKRGFLFSLDALISVIIVASIAAFLGVMVLSYQSPQTSYQRMYYAGKDVITVLEKGTIGSFDNMLNISGYVSSGVLTEDDMNKTVMDLLGSLWANGMSDKAGEIFSAIAGGLLGTSYNYSLRIDGQDIVSSGGDQLMLARLSTIASGYEMGQPVEGYVSRAYLSSVSMVGSEYVYFGGYEGDGNITKTLVMPDYD